MLIICKEIYFLIILNSNKMSKDAQNGFDNMEEQETPVFEVDANNPSAFNVNMEAVSSFQNIEEESADIDKVDEEEPRVIENTSNEEETETSETSETDESDENKRTSDSSTSQDSKEDNSDEEDEEDKQDSEDDVDDEYSDYSDSALIAITEIKEGNFPLDEKDIPKDLTPEVLRDIYRKTNEMRVEKEREELLKQTGEASEFVKFLLEGGDPRIVQDALSTADLTSLNLEENEENQRKVLTALYSEKDLPKEDIQEIVESIFDKGKGYERAIQAQTTLKESQKSKIEQAREQQKLQEEQAKKAQEEFIERVNSKIDEREISGVRISKSKAEELKKAMWEPTEIIEVPDPQTGNMRKVRATKAQALQQKINQDMDMYLAFNLWLLEGGSFDFVKEQAAQEADDDLRALLQRKQKSTSKKKLRRSKNAFEDIANWGS